MLHHPDVHTRLGIALLLVAVGCGTFKDASKEERPFEPDTDMPAEPPSQEPDIAHAPETATDPVPPTAGTTPPAACKVGFTKDIMPRLVDTCGNAACHGGTANAPMIDARSPTLTHEALMDFDFGSLEWSDPHPFPSGAAERDFREAITAWRMCKAPLD